MLDYEWLPQKSIKYVQSEEEKAYNKYISAKKSPDFCIRNKWFEYWLDYVIIRNKHD